MKVKQALRQNINSESIKPHEANKIRRRSHHRVIRFRKRNEEVKARVANARLHKT